MIIKRYHCSYTEEEAKKIGATEYVDKIIQIFKYLGVALSIFAIIFYIAGEHYLFYIVITFLIFGSLALLIMLVLVGLRSKSTFHTGTQGEDEVAAELCDLSDKYTYIRNFKISMSDKWDIDAVMVGPKGVLAIEIKNWKGRFEIREDGIYIYRDKRAEFYKDDLNIQKKRAMDLQAHFRQMGYDIEVRPLFILANDNIFYTRKNIGAWVTTGRKSLETITGLPDKRQFTPTFCKKFLRELERFDNLQECEVEE